MPKPKGNILRISKYLLSCVGFWKFEDSKQNYVIRSIYLFYSMAIKFYFTVVVVSIFIQFIITIANNSSNSNTETFRQLSHLISLLTAHYIMLVTQSAKFDKILSHMTILERSMLESEDKEVSDSHLNEIRYSNHVSYSFSILTLCTGSFFLLENYKNNVSVAKLNKKNNQTLERPLLVELYYYKINKDKHANTLFIANEITIILNTFIIISTKIIIFTCIVFASSVLKKLQIMFRKYAVYNDDIPMNLKCLVSDHCSVIRYVKNLNDSVKYPILLEYILNSMSVAAVSVEVIMEEHNNLMFRPAFYLCLLVVQVFTMGLISNEVIIQSIMLTDALYESPWYDQNKYIQKLLLTVIIRCQRPLVLTIGPFQPMTLGSALAICKASYSYVSLMIRNYQVSVVHHKLLGAPPITISLNRLYRQKTLDAVKFPMALMHMLFPIRKSSSLVLQYSGCPRIPQHIQDFCMFSSARRPLRYLRIYTLIAYS